MWWIFLLVIWGFINIFGGLLIFFEQNGDCLLNLFFPIPSYLIDKSEEYILPGKIIIMGLGNILFLPFTIINLIIDSALVLCCLVILPFNKLFKKKDGEEK